MVDSLGMPPQEKFNNVIQELQQASHPDSGETLNSFRKPNSSISCASFKTILVATSIIVEIVNACKKYNFYLFIYVTLS